MPEINFKEYWQDRDSSMNREDNTGYYNAKAAEHLAIISQSKVGNSVVDFGCGAGELLGPFSQGFQGKITGIDFSSSLIDIARKRPDLAEANLVESEALKFASGTEAPLWMTCGAFNQYSNAEKLTEFIEAFVGNKFAQKLYLFDTIDPVRVVLLRDDIIESWKPQRRELGRLRSFVKRWRGLLKAYRCRTSNQSVVQLGDLGYGVFVGYWFKQASLHPIDVKILASAQFEYRYHAVLTKDGSHGKL